MVSCLLGGGSYTYAEKSDRIEGDLGGELKLQLRCERRGILIIGYIEIGDQAEDALLLLDLDLLGCDLLGGITYCHRGHRHRDLELAALHDYVLAWLEHDLG